MLFKLDLLRFLSYLDFSVRNPCGFPFFFFRRWLSFSYPLMIPFRGFAFTTSFLCFVRSIVLLLLGFPLSSTVFLFLPAGSQRSFMARRPLGVFSSFTRRFFFPSLIFPGPFGPRNTDYPFLAIGPLRHNQFVFEHALFSSP